MYSVDIVIRRLAFRNICCARHGVSINPDPVGKTHQKLLMEGLRLI